MKKSKILIALLLILCYTDVFSANYYWVGDGGDWSDISHWATTSGGSVKHLQIPTTNDDVFFDANSFTKANQVININLSASCKNLNWTGIRFTPTLSGSNPISIYGNLTLSSDLTIQFTGDIFFESTSTGKTIKTFGKQLESNLKFNGVGGEWILSDTLKTSRMIEFNNGHFNSNGQYIDCGGFQSRLNSNRILTMTNSTIDCKGLGETPVWWLNGDNLTYNITKSTILIKNHRGFYHEKKSVNYENVIFEKEFRPFFENLGKTFVSVGCSFKKIIYNTVAGSGFGGSSRNKIDSLVFNNGMEFYGPNSDTIGVYLTKINGIVSGGSVIKKAIFLGNSIINGSNQFDTLQFSSGTANTIQDGQIQTVVKSFVAEGNCIKDIIIESSTSGKQAIIKPGVLPTQLNYASFKDIKIDFNSGVTVSNSINLGNNTGIVFQNRQSRNFYWIGGSGNWSDVSHWSNTSGGGSSGCLPSLGDDVYFDSKSFSSSGQIVNFDLPVISFKSMSWEGASNIPTLQSNADVRCYGSLKLIKEMKVSLTGKLFFQSTSTGNKITSGSNLIDGEVYFNGNGGEWVLQDSLKTSKFMYLINGHLNTNSKFLKCSNFYSTIANDRTLTIVNSTVEVENTSINYWEVNWNINGQNLKLNSANSQINLSRTDSRFSCTFLHGGAAQYHNLRFYNAGFGGLDMQNLRFNKMEFDSPISNNLIGGLVDTLLIRSNMYPGVYISKDSITYLNSTFPIMLNGENKIGDAVLNANAKLLGNNTYKTITLSPGSAYALGAGATQTVTQSILASADCNKSISLESSVSGTQAFLKKVNGTVNVAYLNIQDISATGGATFKAISSSDLGNNAGWTFDNTTSRDLYWVGGTGNWNDIGHWSLTSGGPAENCIPGANDNVFFDSKSFSATDQTVNLNIENALCKNMSWIGAKYIPELKGDYGLRIFGSVTFIPDMKYTAKGEILFKATSPGMKITSANLLLTSPIAFSGAGGEWQLQDSLKTTEQLSLISGKLNANGKVILVRQFFSDYSSNRSLILDNSRLHVEIGRWIVNGTNMQLSETGSSIIINGGDSRNSMMFLHTGAPLRYNFINFISQEASFEINNCTVSKLTVEKNLWMMGGGKNKYDSVIIRGRMDINGFTNDTINALSLYNYAIVNAGCRIKKANFYNSGIIIGNNTFDTLYFSPGFQYTLGAKSTQSITSELMAIGNGCFPIKIQSSQNGVQAFFSKPNGNVSSDFLELRDNGATGGANYYAGKNSTNVSNNTGWNFNNLPGYSYGLGPDTSFCGPGLTLSTKNFNGGIAYLWQDGSTKPTYLVTQTGNYSVTVTYASNCKISDTILVTNLTPNPTVKPIIGLVEATPFSLEFKWTPISSALGYLVSINNGPFIQPSSGSRGLTTLVTNLTPNQTVSITVKALGGSDCLDILSASFSAKTTNIMDIFIPNAFTPNGDGKNDQLKLYGTYKEYTMSIFNQWGELIWTTKQSTGWDGMSRGKPQPSGVYTYVAEVTLYDQKKVIKKGTINLIH